MELRGLVGRAVATAIALALGAGLSSAETYRIGVLAVLTGAVDAGTVRTDTLERMAAEGSIYMDKVRVLNPADPPGFPFACSTELYPEWPLDSLRHTPPAVADRMAGALRALEPGDRAARAARIAGWTDPLDYGPVAELQQSLGTGAFAQ